MLIQWRNWSIWRKAMLAGAVPTLLLWLAFAWAVAATFDSPAERTAQRVHMLRQSLDPAERELERGAAALTDFVVSGERRALLPAARLGERLRLLVAQAEPWITDASRARLHALRNSVEAIPEGTADWERGAFSPTRSLEIEAARRHLDQLGIARSHVKDLLDFEGQLLVASYERQRVADTTLVTLWLPAVLLITSGLTLAGLHSLTAEIRQGLNRVGDNAEALAAGAEAPHQLRSTDEVTRLARRVAEAAATATKKAERLKEAIGAARMDVVEIAPAVDGVTILSGQRPADTEAPEGPPSCLSAWLAKIHPEDRERVAEGLAGLRRGGARSIEFRIPDIRMEWRWMELRARSGRRSRGTGPIDLVDGTASLASAGSADDERITGVLMDVTARQRLTHELKLAVSAAHQANLAKSEFLTRMSHEVRTPLNAILGFAQLLEMDKLTDDQAENAAQITRGGRLLLGLINEVLDLARVEAGKTTLEMESVGVASLVEETVSLMTPLAEKAGVRIEPRSVPAVCVFADRKRLRQVLINLISNAIKYNRPGGSVQILGAAAGDRLCLDVIDQGTGIAHEKLHLLFEPFERLGADLTPTEGTGLGLALSKHLVIAMGGSLTAASEVGAGSRFTVDLERSPEPDIEVVGTAARGRETVRPVSALRVLYVEDNPVNIRLMESIAARHAGVELTTLPGGKRVEESVQTNPPDLVLLDLNLPDLPGDLVLKALKMNAWTRRVPVVMVSADATQAQIDRMRTLGADDYLTKPISVSTVGRLFAKYAGAEKGL